MIKHQYYCLIAGLPDLVPDEKKLYYSQIELRDYLQEELHPKDFELLKLFYLPFDHDNLLNILFKKGKPWDQRGNYKSEFLEQIIDSKLFEEIINSPLPPYFFKFGQLLRSKEDEETAITRTEAEQFFTREYFALMLASKNKFVRQLANYRKDMGNIMLALNGRKYQLPFEDEMIGNDEITNAIKKNRSRDFGLSVEMPEIESLVQLHETPNPLDRELKFDAHLWNFLDEITFFNYFTVERVLVFTLKLFMVARWFALDKEKGHAMFNNLLKDIQSSFEFPEEFTTNYGKKK